MIDDPAARSRAARSPAERDPADETVAQAPEERPRLNAVGEERPTFLLGFPRDPDLEQLMTAFEEGDFAKVRREAPQLARATRDDAVRRAALELRRRIDPDPLLVVLLVFASSLFAFLVAWIYSR